MTEKKISKQDNTDGDYIYEEIDRMRNRGKRKAALKMKPKENCTWNLIFKVRMESREGAGHMKNWCSPPGWGNTHAGALWWKRTGHVQET